MKVVIELIFIVILIVSVWSGYKKGLVMTFGSILIIIISLFVGDLLSDTFSHEAIPVFKPFITGYMDGENGAIEESLAEVTGGTSELLSADDIVERRPELKAELCKLSYMTLGVYSSSAEIMAQEALAHYEHTGSTISTSIVEIMCEKLTYYIGFILFFALSVILLTVLGNISNLSFKIPNHEKINTYGGAVAGLLVGFMFCALAAWVVKFTGMLLPEDDLGNLFAKLFVKMDTFSGFLSI
jgi:hypothetical protein